MNIEIVEFYPLEFNENNGFLSGTLRIKLDIGIHILGIYVAKRKDSWFFQLPGRMSTHHEAGEPIRYPFICFEDREKYCELMEALKTQGRAFIEKRLVDTENPLKFPEKKQQQQKQVVNAQKPDKQPKPSAIEQKLNNDPPIAKKPEPAKSYATIKPNMQWQDPPPRKPMPKKQYSNTRR
jgi:hypothetical protein